MTLPTFLQIQAVGAAAVVVTLATGAAVRVWGEQPPSEPTRPSGGAKVAGLALDESERKRLAEIEHYVLILSQKAFPVLASRLRDSDAVRLRQAFSSSFRGESLDMESTHHARDPVCIRHAQTSDSTSLRQPQTAEGFVRYLIDARKRFESTPKVGFSLRGLAPTEKDHFEGSWQGGCMLRLAGRSADGGPRETRLEFAFRLARIPDVEEVEEATGWIEELRVLEIWEVSSPYPLMEEVAGQRGIDPGQFYDNWSMGLTQRVPVTGGVYVADFDNDDRLDVLITDLNGLFLYRGQADGKFVEVTPRLGLPKRFPPSAAVALGDFDRDGLVDVILGPVVLRNGGEFQFENITWRTNLKMPQDATGCTVVDYDLDGRLDVYVSRSAGSVQNTSWIDGPGGPGNQLWRNLGGWQFEEVAAKVHATAGRRSVFTAAWLDANNDGRPDIYAIGEFGPGALLISRPDGTFKEMPLELSDGDFGTMGLAAGDYDNDGYVDVYTSNMYSKAGRRIFDNLSPDAYPPEIMARIKRFITGSELYRNLGDLRFQRVGEGMALKDVGWSYGSTFVDLDNDGYLDLYANAGFTSVARSEPDG